MVNGARSAHLTLLICLSLEYTISEALSNYVELDFKDREQSSFTDDT